MKKLNKDLGKKRKMSFNRERPDEADYLIMACIVLGIMAIIAFIIL